MEPDPPAKKNYFCFSCDRLFAFVPEEKKAHELTLKHSLFEDTWNLGKVYKEA